LVLDSGNLLVEGGSLSDLDEKSVEQQKLKARLIAASYVKMGYDAVNLGPYDLALGVGFLKSIEKTYRIRFISTNLVDGKGRFLFQPYLVKNVGHRRVAIFGITAPASVPPSASAHVIDPVESIKRAIAQIKGKVDFLVALTEQDSAQDRRLAEALPDLNLILRGKSSDFPRDPILIGKTSIFEIGSRGQRVGRIAIDRGETGRPRWDVAEMDKAVGEDPGIRAMIAGYNGEVVRLFKLGRRQAETLNAEICSKCHEREYAQWQKTAHAKAYTTLVQINREFDPECLRCHTTRFNAPGGFSMRDQQAGLRHVQCDACHGRASKHAEHPKQEKPTRPDVSTCVKCHTPQQSPAFTERYREYLEKIKCPAHG
jgi:hypothetical protein